MEPANLDPQPDDKALEALLKSADPGPIPDSGFSARVLAALPIGVDPALTRSRGRAAYSKRRIWIAGMGLAAGLGLALATGSLQIDFTSLDSFVLSSAQSLQDQIAHRLLTDPWSLGIVLAGLVVALLAWQDADEETIPGII